MFPQFFPRDHIGEGKTDTKSSESSSTKKGGKGGEESHTNTETSKSTSSVTPAGYADYKEYVVALDVRAYHSFFSQLTDLRNHYIKAHVLFHKNMKRLSDPRGDGEDGRSAHSMSMF